MRPLRPQVVAWLLVSTMTNERYRKTRLIDSNLVDAETKLIMRFSDREANVALQEAVEGFTNALNETGVTP